MREPTSRCRRVRRIQNPLVVKVYREELDKVRTVVR